MIDLHLFYSIAAESAKSAGLIIRKGLGGKFSVEHKGRVDLVTDIDKSAEEAIKLRISKAFPEHQILAEESELTHRESDFRWIIDPLDGTTNFTHGYPVFSVSIALEYQGKVILGLIYDPMREELFSAIRGKGAFLNDAQIRVSATESLLNSLLATGFPYVQDEKFHLNFEHFKTLYMQCQGIRRGGSAALDLAYVACGRFDGYWEYNLKPWDCAAGALIVEEAGGIVTQSNGDDHSPYIPDICVSNGLIHADLIILLS